MKPPVAPVHQPLVINRLLSHLTRAPRLAQLLAAAAVSANLGQGELVAAATADGKPLQRLRMLPMGSFTLRDGRGPFSVTDQAHAQSIVDASLTYAGNRDIPFDYDHQLMHAIGAGKGGTAPASGWVKGLTAAADGIYADVEWTPAAAAAMAAGEYRYISPTFAFDAATGGISSIRYGSLVNDNAIDALLAVAATTDAPQEMIVDHAKIAAALGLAATTTIDAHQKMIVDHAKIAAALGLAATATIDDILAAIAKEAIGDPATGAAMGAGAKMAAAATALGLAATATGDEIVAAATATAAAAANPDPAKFVPAASLTTVTARLAVLETERRDAIVAAASEAGKLVPSMTDWAKDYVAKDEAGFAKWLAAAPAIVAAGAMAFDQRTTETGDRLVAAASTYQAEQAGRGITVTADAAVRHVLSTSFKGA